VCPLRENEKKKDQTAKTFEKNVWNSVGKNFMKTFWNRRLPKKYETNFGHKTFEEKYFTRQKNFLKQI
jgi:hypothetical protein